MKALLLVFATVFLAELGDKTQLATLLFAADPGRSRVGVFAAAASALVASSAIAVLLGGWIGRLVPPRILTVAAGIGFLAVGVWTLWTGLKAPE